MPKSVDEIEAQAEHAIAEKLGIYQKAAPTIGIVFAAIMAAFSIVLITGGALAGALLSAATAVILLWFVSLIRAARLALTPAP